MEYKITDIDWCVDEAEDLENLPKETSVTLEDERDIDLIADALSDKFGFLVNSYNYEKKD